MAETEQVGGMQRTGQASVGASSGGPAEKALATAAAMRERLMAMPSGKRTWLIASGVFLAAMCAGMAWFAGRPDWRVLFSGLDGKDVQQVSQELAAAGIPYEITADGSGVQVSADMLDKARMEVAAKGMPQTGRLGFELFDKPNWVGSEFDERVNYQRAEIVIDGPVLPLELDPRSVRQCGNFVGWPGQKTPVPGIVVITIAVIFQRLRCVKFRVKGN